MYACFIVLQLRSDSCQMHRYVMLCYHMACLHDPMFSRFGTVLACDRNVMTEYTALA